MQDFMTQDWIWIANHSMFIFCTLDGIIDGQGKLAKQIIKDNLNEKIAKITFYIMITLLIAILFYIFLIWAPPALTLTIFLFETIIRLHHNYTNTKSLTDEDDED